MTPEELKQLDTLEKVDRIKVMDLQPGDVIVVESDYPLSSEQVDKIQRFVGSVFNDHKVLVCDRGIRISAARVTTRL